MQLVLLKCTLPYLITNKVQLLWPQLFFRYSTVMKCWTLNPEDRPDFKQLESKVGKLLSQVADYMELTMELLPAEESEG